MKNRPTYLAYFALKACISLARQEYIYIQYAVLGCHSLQRKFPLMDYFLSSCYFIKPNDFQRQKTQFILKVTPLILGKMVVTLSDLFHCFVFV
jgi:hypothetical protein